MTKKGREFNEIYDLTAMRVIVDSVKDCYGAIGVIHSLWKPLPGRFKDLVAMPKFNMYQALHTTVIGPEGRPLEIQIRTATMHEHRRVRRRRALDLQGGRTGAAAPTRRTQARVAASRCSTGSTRPRTRRSSPRRCKADLFEDEVFVFTPKGEVKSLAAGATPLDFAYEIHTDVGHRCVGREGERQDRAAALRAAARATSCEVLTSKQERGPSRDWLALAKTTRARNKIRAWFKRESREDSEHSGREILQENLKQAGLPAQKIAGSPLLADVIREMGFRKADDFYIALGRRRSRPRSSSTR